MTTDQPPPRGEIPELGRFEKGLLGTVTFGALGVGGMGLYSSYDSVSDAATRWGFDPSWILPVALDISIPVFSLANLLLIRFDMPLAWVRLVPWGLTAVTVYMNVEAAGDSLAARIGHGALPLLWVTLSEIVAHVYRVMIGAATGRRMEGVRRSRWFLAPGSTSALWRRMKLWEITSYRTALKLERNRILARADLREEFGWNWRWKKDSRRQRVLLRLGELEPAVPVTPPQPRKELEEAKVLAPRGQTKGSLNPELAEPAGPVGTPAWELLAEHPRDVHPPVVYFNRVGRQVKIGCSRSLDRRLMDLALDWSDLALLLHGGKRLEADLHTRFKPYRLGRSEWFAVEGELAEFIASFGAGDSSGTGARSGLGASSGSTDKKELAPVPSGAKTAPGDKNLPGANSVAGDSSLTSGFVSGASSRPEIADALAPARMEELLAESRLEIDPVFLPGASVPGAKKSVPGPGANSGAGDSKAGKAGARLATEAPVSEKLATEGEPRPGAKNGAGDNSEVPGASGKRRKRRPMDEWVELATPIFHAEFTRRRRQPTGEEFAEALELAGYGAVSASTAKNIRTQILDTTELPALV